MEQWERMRFNKPAFYKYVFKKSYYKNFFDFDFQWIVQSYIIFVD